VSQKKQLELQLFDEFRRLLPELHLRRIEQPDPPAPDILADFHGTRVGIEITRQLNGPKKHRESEEERIIEMARQQYQASGSPTVGVSVHWVTHEPRTRTDRQPTSEALASVVAQNVPLLGRCCHLDWSSLPEPLASTVHQVRIDRLIDYSNSDWRMPRAGWFPSVHADDIRTAVAKKERYIDGYQEQCDTVWLLIVAEGFGPSSWCELPNETRQQQYITRFGRLFFLGTLPREAIELSARSPRL